MPFQKGNTIGQDTRFKKGQSGGFSAMPASLTVSSNGSPGRGETF